MLDRPIPTLENPITFADALSVCLDVGLGRRDKRAWAKAKDINDAIARDRGLAPGDPNRILGKETFTGEALIKAARGKTLPHAKTLKLFQLFLTHREKVYGAQWRQLLADAHEYSKSLDKLDQLRNDGLVAKLVASVYAHAPEAIHFAQGLGLTDYRRLQIAHDSNPSTRREVLDSPVTLGLLRSGLYLPRSGVEEQASKKLRSFLLEQTGTKEPTVFWLDGRSGDGKSVMLFRLPLFLRDLNHHFIHIDRLQSLRDLDIFSPDLFEKRLVLVIDDLAKALQEKSENEFLRAKFKEFRVALKSGHVPSITLLTCGPTPEMKFFRERFDDVSISHYTVPRLSSIERKAFADWFGFRQGEEKSSTDHLVEFLFVLSQGMSLQQFAASFRERLSGVFDLFLPVFRVMVGSAFELPTPESYVQTVKQKNALSQLAAPDQEHFWYDTGEEFKAVRFSHNAISKSILREWMADPSFLNQLERLADALAEFMKPCHDERFAFRVTERLRLHPHHASEICGQEISVSDLLQALHLQLTPGSVGWLSVASAYSSDIAMQESRERAAEFLNSYDFSAALQPNWAATSSVLMARVAELATLVADAKHYDLREKCIEALLTGQLSQASGYAVGHLVARKVEAPDIIEKWMILNPAAHRPPELICAANHTNRMLEEAKVWLKANGDTQQSIKVAAWLIQDATNVEEALDRIGDWFRTNTALRGQYSTLAQLLQKYPYTKDLGELALNWFSQSRLEPGAGQVLEQLVLQEPYSSKLGLEVLSYAHDCLDSFGMTNLTRDRLGLVLHAAAKKWHRRRSTLWICSVRLIREFPDSDLANKLFTTLAGWPERRSNYHYYLQLLEISDLLIASGREQPTMHTHLPTHLKFFSSDKRIDQAYRWLDESPHSGKTSNVANCLLELAPDSEKIWRWIEFFGNNRGNHTVVQKYFSVFHEDQIQRQKVFGWIDSNRDQPGAQQVWTYVNRKYPQYKKDLGGSLNLGNAPSHNFGEIDRARHAFQADPTLKTAQDLDQLVRANPASGQSIGAINALLKFEIDGFDPFGAAKSVFDANFGNTSAIVFVAKMVAKFDLDSNARESIRNYILLHRGAGGIVVPLLAALDHRLIDIEDVADLIIEEMLSRPNRFGVHAKRIGQHLSHSEKVVHSEKSEFLRLVSNGDFFYSEDLNRLIAKRIAQDKECVSFVGQPTSPEASALWSTVLRWIDAPPNVQGAFYDWCNEMIQIGWEHHAANVLQSGKFPPWLDLSKIGEPLRRLVLD